MPHERDEILSAVVRKMEAEYEAFQKTLLKMPPEKILENAYRYVIFGELINAVKSFMSDSPGNYLDDGMECEQMKALGQLEFPLSLAYDRFLKSEWDTVDILRHVIIDLSKQEEE